MKSFICVRIQRGRQYGYYANSEDVCGYDRPCSCLLSSVTIRLMVLATVSLSPMLAVEGAPRRLAECLHGRRHERLPGPRRDHQASRSARPDIYPALQPQIVAHVLFYMRQTPPQPQPLLVAEAWPDGESKVLVDTNATQGDTAIV